MICDVIAAGVAVDDVGVSVAVSWDEIEAGDGGPPLVVLNVE